MHRERVCPPPASQSVVKFMDYGFKVPLIKCARAPRPHPPAASGSLPARSSMRWCPVALAGGASELTHPRAPRLRSWRFGMDAIMGVIPYAGDASGAVVGTFIIGKALRYNLPKRLVMRESRLRACAPRGRVW